PFRFGRSVHSPEPLGEATFASRPGTAGALTVSGPAIGLAPARVAGVTEGMVMSDPDEFQELIGQVRAGVEGAATRLTRKFEPFVLRYARFRMRSLRNYDRMRPQFGSSDICQSVFKSLFEGLRDGRFELSRPEHLEKLLCTMARLKIATNARKLGVVL